MDSEFAFDDINEAKASWDYIYDQNDPRPYFSELIRHGYSIPDAAKPVFHKLISHLRLGQRDGVNVLDLGCSYGVNAALLKHNLTMRDLYAHWGQDEFADATSEEVVEQDQQFFAASSESDEIKVIGIDVAENAISYAKEVGLLDEGLAVNLETERLPAEFEQDLASVDLVTSTGCVGYITEKSFERLMPAICAGKQPWIANFVLRMFPFDGIAETLWKWGYVTQKLAGRTFAQRQFASADEREQVVQQMVGQGINPRPEETSSQLLAELYISRPSAEDTSMPLAQLIAP